MHDNLQEETKSEVGMVESYTQIAARVQAWEKKSDLDGIRAELELQVALFLQINSLSTKHVG